MISWFKKTTETAAAASVSAAQKSSFVHRQQKVLPSVSQSGAGRGYSATGLAENNTEPVRRQSRFNALPDTNLRR
jgi:hypothetical protein